MEKKLCVVPRSPLWEPSNSFTLVQIGSNRGTGFYWFTGLFNGSRVNGMKSTCVAFCHRFWLLMAMMSHEPLS